MGWSWFESAPAPAEEALPPEPFAAAALNGERLLSYAAEMSIEVPAAVAASVLAGRDAAMAGPVPVAVRAEFYGAYTKLADLFNGATVDSIRACSSAETKAKLARDKVTAVVITVVIALFSVASFVTDDLAKRIVAETAAANDMAVKLRAGLTAGPEAGLPDVRYAVSDPCDLITIPPDGKERQVRNADDVALLQSFSGAIRDLRSRAIKLNWVVLKAECDPYDLSACPKLGAPAPNEEAQKAFGEKTERAMQLNPTIINYAAEVFCKIRAFQQVRSFSSNVQGDYMAAFGAVVGNALPIGYALLGAYAFRLRLFGETIRKRTYHPSFADSARMITAVIAGAIISLFYPAQGATISPLAMAFLVGYGVEIFFKFLDGMIGSLGARTVPAGRPDV